MWCTCSTLGSVKMIQIRNVPDELHRSLMERAAASGLSLSDYIKDRLTEMVAVPTPDELVATIEGRTLGALDSSVVAAVRADRDAR